MNVKEVKADLQERKHQNKGHEVSFILSPRWRAALVLQAWWRSTKVPAMARPPADEDGGRGIEACMSPLRFPPAPPLAPWKEMATGFTVADWTEKFAAYQFKEMQSDFFGNS